MRSASSSTAGIVATRRGCAASSRPQRAFSDTRHVSQDALDACVEAGERRRFQVEASCRRWRRIYQSCALHGSLDCSRQLGWLRDCISKRD